MRRSRLLAIGAVLSALAFLTSPTPAEGPIQINGIGLLDYATGRSECRVGTWARYRMFGRSELGVTSEYTVTVLIAGEEEWWGEDCFWVETQTVAPGQPPRTAATLMSYAIFDDSLAIPHMQLYMRKTIPGLNPDGTPAQELYKRAASSLKSREPVGGSIRWNVDTLATDTVVTTPKGAFRCRQVRIEQGTGVTAQAADSSLYTEVRETRLIFLTGQVPVTHVAREEIDYGAWRRTWLIGRSQESGPMRVMDRSRGAAELEDFGTSGWEAKLVPPAVRRSLAERRAAVRAGAAKAPARPGSTPAGTPARKR